MSGIISLCTYPCGLPLRVPVSPPSLNTVQAAWTHDSGKMSSVSYRITERETRMKDRHLSVYGEEWDAKRLYGSPSRYSWTRGYACARYMDARCCSIDGELWVDIPAPSD